ncbi:hypothetical protein ACEYW6_01115 [Nostoc sp. UIC 10607]|uniref:hypothetical protein n=1 Tax=Nostoc sp. UIC 10607 TaxID=3045935 RepID=UPI0039A2C826
MQSKVFKSDNYIYECKSATGDIGGSIELSSLKPEVEKLKRRWSREGTPKAYYYVFPANLISNECRKYLDELKFQYRGEVDINYYDYQQVQRLIHSLAKLSDMQSLVDYIRQAGGI